MANSKGLGPAIALLVLVALAVGVGSFMGRHRRVPIATINLHPDEYDGVNLLIEGAVTPDAPKESGVLIGYYGAIEIDDGTAKVGVHFDDKKIVAPAAGAHVVVKARALRPENVSLGLGDVPHERFGPLQLVADEISVK